MIVMNTLNEENVTLLSPSKRLGLLRSLLSGVSPVRQLERMTPLELIDAQDFIWEKALEIGIRVKGEKFSQTDIIRRIKSTELYKSQVGCREPFQRCEVNDCVHVNPDCMRRKLQEQIESIYKIVAGYLQIEYSQL